MEGTSLRRYPSRSASVYYHQSPPPYLHPLIKRGNLYGTDTVRFYGGYSGSTVGTPRCRSEGSFARYDVIVP